MSLNRTEVEHIAQLARLTLSEEEKDLYREQLSAILENFTRLQEVDTEHIPPFSSTLSAQRELRVDDAHQELTRKELLANAPQAEDDQFRVPPVRE